MARPASDVDPRRLDVRRRKRKRKARSKPEPCPLNKASEADAVARLKDQPANPGVLLEPTGDHGWRFESPHNDPSLWEAQLTQAFGTTSRSVITVFLRDLKRLCATEYDEDAARWKPNETELNAALAMVNDIQPRSTMEAALAAQMIAVHWMQMRLSRDALNNGGAIADKQASLAGKLARTFTMQLDQLRALRGGKQSVRQTIKVEKTLRQEVHYHDHRTGGVGKTDDQSDAKPIDGGELNSETTGRIADLREVPCENQGGQIVPLARRKG